ncbi:nuclear speckle splicing regulatory protein 1 isoform 1-T1 [Eudromia elegans]
MKQTKLEIQKALAEDATVYEYDSIYDEMQQKKKESNAKMLSGKDEKKPRYIQNILKAAEIRKKEQDKRMDRKIQKEREMEGGEFADKEAFVTSAYKKKLQERAEEEERERREAALEACLDVTKQKDLSGFYRHLLKQKVGEEEMPKCSFREARIKEEKSNNDNDESIERNKGPDERRRLKPSVKEDDNPDADTDLGSNSSDDDKRCKNNKVKLKQKERRNSSVSSEEESKHDKNRRHSRSPGSPSEEDKLHTKPQMSHPKRGESRTGRLGNDELYREKDYERRSRTQEKDHQREKEEHHRHGDRTSRDNYRRREDQDDKHREKERREREEHSREWRKAKERDEKCSEREREKERLRNGRDKYNDREKERGEKYREKEDHVKEKYSSDEKKHRHRRERSPASLEKDGGADLEKHTKGKEREVDEKSSSSSGLLSEPKRKAGEEGEKEEKEQAQKPPQSISKFAKRSNEETVMSARDRYLARQMARVGTKSYIEKEED